ncbi:MAG: aldo/keto reductase [Dehalococcoidales bacterium]|nr:aldo/keto reductase [Dehalococcoidales bacterium]
MTVLGLGGEGVLRTWDRDAEAERLIERALGLGINYFESARAYAGSESYYGAALRERRPAIFLTSKTASRSAEGALRDLDATLKNMRTDYLDLWQLHDLRHAEEWEQAKKPNGVLAALRRAKADGRVRFIGVTGHHDPRLLARALEEFDFDTVLMPVNVAEVQYPGFLDVTLPAAIRKGMGIIGMKVLCRGLLVDQDYGLTATRLIRFALSQPVSLITVGCDNVGQLEENVEAARRYSPPDEHERNELIALTHPYADEAIYYRPL